VEASILTTPELRNEALTCGALRREPDGSWFLGASFLGRDGDAEASMREAEASVGVVAIRLAAALELACEQLRSWGDAAGVSQGTAVLRKYHRWQSTGQW